jgi:hypothetical protein
MTALVTCEFSMSTQVNVMKEVSFPSFDIIRQAGQGAQTCARGGGRCGL